MFKSVRGSICFGTGGTTEWPHPHLDLGWNVTVCPIKMVFLVLPIKLGIYVYFYLICFRHQIVLIVKMSSLLFCIYICYKKCLVIIWHRHKNKIIGVKRESDYSIKGQKWCCHIRRFLLTCVMQFRPQLLLFFQKYL